MIEKAKEFIKGKFPRVDFKKLGPIGFGRKPGNENTIGSKGGETKIFKQDGRSLLKNFTDKYKNSLGPEAESLIDKDNVIIREYESQIRNAERITTEKEETAKKMQHLRNKIERTKASMEQLDPIENESEYRQKQQLLKNYETDYENEKKKYAALEKQEKEQTRVDQLRASRAAKESERNTLEERLNTTKTLDDLNEQVNNLERKNEEDKEIINDENTSPSERAAAEERVAEREEELARLNTQIDEREKDMPLRERIKEIFKNTVLQLQQSLLLLVSRLEQ